MIFGSKPVSYCITKLSTIILPSVIVREFTVDVDELVEVDIDELAEDVSSQPPRKITVSGVLVRCSE